MTYSELGAALRAMRESRGISREEMAQALGCTRGAVAHYEAGRRKIPIDHIDAWGRLCDRTLSIEFLRTSDESAAALARLNRAIRALSPAHQELVIRLAESLPGHDVAREGVLRQIEVLERFGRLDAGTSAAPERATA